MPWFKAILIPVTIVFAMIGACVLFTWAASTFGLGLVELIFFTIIAIVFVAVCAWILHTTPQKH